MKKYGEVYKEQWYNAHAIQLYLKNFEIYNNIEFILITDTNDTGKTLTCTKINHIILLYNR